MKQGRTRPKHMRYRRPKPSERWASNRDGIDDGRQALQLREAWADYLRGYNDVSDAPWALFVTLTFREPVHAEQAGKRFDRFLDGCTRGGRDRVRWVRATERQARGVIHFHLLLSAVPSAAPFGLVRLWKRLGGGYADIKLYDPARGAAWYIAKAIVEGGDIDVGGF